jgi:hypothetical protein
MKDCFIKKGQQKKVNGRFNFDKTKMQNILICIFQPPPPVAPLVPPPVALLVDVS